MTEYLITQPLPEASIPAWVKALEAHNYQPQRWEIDRRDPDDPRLVVETPLAETQSLVGLYRRLFTEFDNEAFPMDFNPWLVSFVWPGSIAGWHNNGGCHEDTPTA